MIKTHLSDSNNEILVFEPASSKGTKIKEKYKDLVNLEKLGINIIGENEPNYPQFLRHYFERALFVFNINNLNAKYDYSLISSSKPENEEIELVKKYYLIVQAALYLAELNTIYLMQVKSKRLEDWSLYFLPSGIANFVEKIVMNLI